MGYITVMARVARDLWQRKRTLSSGYALGLDWFTAINPWPRAITITNGPPTDQSDHCICYNYILIASIDLSVTFFMGSNKV